MMNALSKRLSLTWKQLAEVYVAEYLPLCATSRTTEVIDVGDDNDCKPVVRLALIPRERELHAVMAESATWRRQPKSALAHPSGDKRFKLLEVTMKRHQFQPRLRSSKCCTRLRNCLASWRSICLFFIARHLKLPPSKVFGVATFYNFFSLRPKGEHTCVVCTGTACYVKGADELLKAIERLAGIKASETTADGKLSLVTARCLGACGIAPAVVLDGTVKGKETPESVVLPGEGMALAWTLNNFSSSAKLNSNRDCRCASAAAWRLAAFQPILRRCMTG